MRTPTTGTTDERVAHEIAHGRHLAASDPEAVWGWSTPAGRIRAQRRAALIVRAAQLAPGKRVLEVGCGTGMFTEMFAAAGARIVAIDISPELLALAGRRRLSTKQVQWICGRVEDLGGREHFDAMIGSSVLHHLDLGSALEAMHRLLNPGGVLSFAEPNMLNPQVWLERHPGPLARWFDYVSPDETAFVRWRLARTLTVHGFRDARAEPFDWLHPSTPAALVPLLSLAGRAAEALPLVREFAGSLHITARKGAGAR